MRETVETVLTLIRLLFHWAKATVLMKVTRNQMILDASALRHRRQALA